MIIDFTNLLQRFYPSQEATQNDSCASNLLVKAIAKLNLLGKYRANFDSLSPKLFSELESSILRKNLNDSRIAEAGKIVEKFFSYYTPLVRVNEMLSSSLLDMKETLWIEKEAPAILEFLKMIQDKCSAHLTQPLDASIENQRKTIMGHIQKVPLKNHIPMPSPAAIEVPKAEPASLEAEELLPLSSTLQKLDKKLAQLKELEVESEKLFVALKAWKEAKAKGLKTELPDLEHFEKVRAMIKEISREELNFPPNLLKKVAMCSAAAGRALEQIAEQTQKVNDQIKERKNTLKSHFLERLSDFSIWKLSKGMNGRMPSFGDVLQHVQAEPNPELSIVSLLGSIDWLNNLPETKLENLKQAFLNLSPAERNQLENLLKTSASPEEFFPKLSQYYEERVKAVEEKTRKDNQNLDTQRRELDHQLKIKESMLATLAEEKNVLESEKSKLAAEIKTLRQNLSKTDAEHAKAKEDSTRKIKELETHCQHLKKEILSLTDTQDQIAKLSAHIEELNKQTGTLDTEKAELAAEIQNLRQHLSKIDTDNAKAKAESAKKINDLESNCENLQKELESASQSRKALVETREKVTNLTKQIVVLSEKSEKTQSTVATLHKQLEEQTKAFAEAKSKKADLKKQIVELQERNKLKLADAQVKLSTLQDDLKEQQGLVTTLERGKEALELKIQDISKQYEVESAAAHNKIKSLITETTKERNETVRLKKEKMDLERRISELTNDSSYAQEDCDALKEQLKTVEEVLATLNSHYSETEYEVKQRQAIFNAGGHGDWQWLEHLKGVLKIHDEQIHKVKLEKTDREHQISQLSHIVDMNQIQIPYLQGELKKLEDELIQQKTLVADLEAKQAIGRQEIRDLNAHFERELDTAGNALAKLQQELEQQKQLLAASEQENTVLSAKVGELTEQLQEAESRLQSQPRKVAKRSQLLEDSTDLTVFMMKMERYFTEEKNRPSLPPSMLLDRLKEIHLDAAESAINWSAITVLTHILPFRFGPELTFELLNLKIKSILLEQELKVFEENKDRYYTSNIYRYGSKGKFDEFLKNDTELFIQPMREIRNKLKIIEAMKLFFRDTTNDWSLQDEISDLYNILSFKKSLLNYNNPVKFTAEKSGIKGIVFCNEGVNFWDKCGFLVSNEAIDHMYLCLFDKHDHGNLPIRLEVTIPVERATEIYAEIIQSLKASFPIEFEKQLRELENKVSDLENDKLQLDAQLSEMKGILDSENCKLVQKKYDEFVAKIDGKIKQYKERIDELTKRREVIAKTFTTDADLHQNVEQLTKELEKFKTK